MDNRIEQLGDCVLDHIQKLDLTDKKKLSLALEALIDIKMRNDVFIYTETLKAMKSNDITVEQGQSIVSKGDKLSALIQAKRAADGEPDVIGNLNHTHKVEPFDIEERIKQIIGERSSVQ